MASAKTGVHASRLKPVTVPQLLLDGSKVLRWEDESSIPQTVTLRVDAKGYLLYWLASNGDVDYLEMSFIRDTRCGKSARLPKDPKLRDACLQFGGPASGALEDRTVTVVVGSDLINLQWMNFVASDADTAQLWASEIFQCCTNTLSMNPSFYDLLERAWTKLVICKDSDARVPVKSLLRLIATHKDDKKRVEKSLSACKLLSSKPDFIDANALTLKSFLKFFGSLCSRLEVDQICLELNPAGAKSKQPFITTAQFVRLLNERQRDPRLNEILYPYANEAKARELIIKYEPDGAVAAKGQLSSAGLEAFLMSQDNDLIPRDKLDLSQDMEQPLAHYFINSSHNTYLAGHQLTGKSSVEMYRQVLLTGCRCVELDCWDGKSADEEPMVTHGFTMCSEVSFRETLEAIADTAFKVSDFPVILSFENHCSPKQQAKMVKLIKDYLGDKILAQPLDSHPLKPGTPLPSPELLRGKFLIKNKKRHVKKSAKQSETGTITEEDGSQAADPAAGVEARDLDDDEVEAEDEDPELRKLRESAETGASTSASTALPGSSASQASKEPEALSEISAMVNYMEPAAFYSFEYATKKNAAYECCSISENSATNLLKEAPEDFVNFNKRQISRIYPKGTRVDSSNYMPQLFWNSGCQLVALNFQTLDLGLQLNLGMFHHQRRCGYLLKPEFMRRADRRFDPFSESTVDGIVASSVSVQILSAYFLSDRRVNTYVEVEMYGLPADTVRKRFRTRVVPANGINPSYNQEAFVFKKVVLPQLATLRIAVLEESGRLIGQRFLPVDSLRPGYRHVPLFTELMQPLPLASLFVCLTVSDYVSDVFAEFAAALSNPIQYLSEMDKHQQQLMVLTDDFEVSDKPQQQRAIAYVSEPQQQLEASATERSPNKQRKLLRALTLEPREAPTSPPMSEATAQTSASKPAAADNAGASGIRRKFMSVYTKTNDQQQQQQQHQNQADHLHSDQAGLESSESFVDRCLLSDSNCIPKLSLDELKKDKKYQKLVQKYDKEYLAMLKRNQKDLVALRAKHRQARAKTNSEGGAASSTSTSSSTRRFFGRVRRGSGDKGPPEAQSQSMRLHASQEDVRDRAARSASEKELKNRATLQPSRHDAEVRDQLESHARAEFELQRSHRVLLRDELLRALQTAAAISEKCLASLYSQEHAALKKAQERQRNAEVRQLSKQFKARTVGAGGAEASKAELREARRECQQRQVAAAVGELQALDGLHKKRLGELREHFDQLRLLVEKDFDEETRQLDEEQLSRLVDINKASVANASSTAAP